MGSVKWTKEQLDAINEDRNNVLVAAAAGSGKTAVLVERIIDKIINKNIDINNILVVTFTNAAAAEMRERVLEAIYKKMDQEPNNERLAKQIMLLSKANICTIDSFCLDVVKNNFYELGISPNFRIADTAELEILKQETLEDLFEEKYEKKDSEFLKLLEAYATYLSDDPLKELVVNIYNFIQSNPFPKDWLNQKVEEFNIKDNLEKDFSQNLWGEIILKNIKEEIFDCKLKLKQIQKELEKFSELEKFANIIKLDIEVMDKILKTTLWDEIFDLVNTLKFEKWPVDKKITLEEKNIAKDKRDKIKKQFNKSIEIINCTSKEANLDIYNMYELLQNLKEVVFEFDELFKKNKAEKNMVDFNDIEHFALNILLKKGENGEYNPTEVAKKYREKFNEIAIDEYQDSNLVQEYILKSVSNGRNMFMVGDVKQSIYKFRQACPELFLHKYNKYIIEEDYTKDSITDGIKIQLFKNFRSRENILNTTNEIFYNIMSRELGDIEYNEDEFLNIGASFEETNQEIIATNTKVHIIENADSNDEILPEEQIENIELEAKFVAKKIKDIIDSKKVVFDKKVGYRPVTYKDIVILLRATKQKANIFEKEISKYGMPVFSDTSAEYLDSIEIQTIMNLLKTLDNPMQDIPLVTVLRSFIGGFTDNELIKIRVDTNRNISFYESMKQYIKQKEDIDDILKTKIQEFLNRIEKWQSETEYQDLDEFIWKIYEETGYYDYVGLMPNGLLRQANLRSLFEKAKQYEQASFKGLYNFINFIDKLKNSSGDLSSAKLIGENENVIRIMSIHKSKGLEFPIVFLCCANKNFNMQDLNAPIILHQELGIGVNYIDVDKKLQYNTFSKEAIKIITKNELLSEEMRVLYVALTRAKEQLIVTGVTKNAIEDIEEKKENLNLYSQSKINKNILKKYKSYLDWIELVALNNNSENNIELCIEKKESIIKQEKDSKEKEAERDIKDILEHTEGLKENENIINKLEWKYPNIKRSKMEAKTSVSKIKSGNTIIKTNEPNFINEKESISNARKGTIIHLCMQKLNIDEEQTKETIENLLNMLESKGFITSQERLNIDTSKVYNFTKSNIWKELKQAKVVEREKTFYINIPAKEIYNEDVEDKILVQGIIDLYYINKEDELILVDYKTDYIKNDIELIEKYKIQLELYKKALEGALNKKVDKVYIYSTCLNKEIEVE